jgi:PAS domain S-box-containing protein
VDISDRKLAQESLNLALQKLNFHIQNTPLAVIEWDQNLRVIRWSPSCDRIFGWKAEEVMGKHLSEWSFVVEEDHLLVDEAARQLVDGEVPYLRCCNRHHTKDGTIVYIEWHNSNLVDESGKMVSVLSLGLDITERQQGEQEREQLLERERQAREDAETINRIKDEFLAVLSHELRSPLNPILGWTKLLQTRQFDPQSTTRALQIIERNAKLQAQLIEDLLDVSRILRGKLVLNVAPVNLITTIQAALETMELAASAKGIQIQTQLTPVGLIQGDAGRLQQVVWNLLSNAIKFTPTGGRVEVSLERVSHYAQIQVKDNGKGIIPEFLPYVFDYFRQADSSTTRQFGGLGLGLAIVRHLTELHGGAVAVESPGEGRGATFTVKLPLNEVVRETPSLKGQEAEQDLKGVRILVVDDEADMQQLAALILESVGANVQVAASATEALGWLAAFQPDLLLSDIGMPGMNGYELMRQVRARSPEKGGEILAIALTAYAGETNKQQAHQAGFQKHIAKPIEPDQLIQIICELIKGSGQLGVGNGL